MYLSRYSSADNSSLTKGKYHHHRPSTRRKTSTQRPSTSYKRSYSSAKTAIKTQYKTTDHGFERPSSRHSNKRSYNNYNQSSRKTARRTYKDPTYSRTLKTSSSSSKPIKLYHNDSKIGIDLTPSLKSISLKHTHTKTKKKKLMSDYQRKSARKLKTRQDNLTASLLKQYEGYSVKNSSSMKYLESMIAKINLARVDIEKAENAKKSSSDYPKFGHGTSRIYTKTKTKTKKKISIDNPHTDRPSRKKTKNKSNVKYRKARHDSGRTLKKLGSLYKHAQHGSYSHANLNAILNKKDVDIDRDLLYHHKTMRKSQSSADVNTNSSKKRVQSAQISTKKIKATVASQSHTSRKMKGAPYMEHMNMNEQSNKKTKKSRSAQNMVPHHPQKITIHRKKGGSTNSKKEIIEIRDIKTAKLSSKKRDNRSVSDSQMQNVSNVKALKMKDLDIKSLLGEGAFSKVFLVKFKDTANVRKNVTDKLRSDCHQIALKVIPRQKKNKKDKDSKNLMWERLVLSQLKHPFIVQYFGTFSDDKRVCILMEFIIGGEILYHFENCRLGRFPPNVSRFYIAEIICALEYVHSTGFIYRDLKPENILLDHEGHVKMVDFGFAKQLRQGEMTYTLCGSKEYVAPEVLVGNGHNKSVDLWSLGVLCFEFVIGHLPFPTQDSNPYEVLDIIKSTKLVFPQFVSKIIQNFVKRLLTLNPNKRLGNNGFEEVKNHEWFEEFDWIKCNSKQLKPPIIPRYASEDDVTNFASARFDDDTANDDRNDDNYNAFKDLQLF